jgi:hypothetical protein
LAPQDGAPPVRLGSIQIWKMRVVSGLQIVLCVADARAGAHHLDVASLGAALVAQAVLVGDGPLADIGDDLHVGVGMGRKARVRRDLVVVPHAQGAVVHVRGIVVAGEREVMLGLEPAVVGAAELREGFAGDHENLLPHAWGAALSRR